jgi:3-deoxy-D-manno-octulosonate 8-phosphate phosphatase (KDO 8-P phosphatase)
MKVFILDVDGVLSTGQFYYSESGKLFKVFGPDDHDALLLLNKYLEIRFVSGDKSGFKISKKRIEDDMNFKLDLVSTYERIKWIKDRFDPMEVIYMGDGIFDHFVMDQVGYSIAPSSADFLALEKASFVTKREAANRAVSEACLHVYEKFFSKDDKFGFFSGYEEKI